MLWIAPEVYEGSTGSFGEVADFATDGSGTMPDPRFPYPARVEDTTLAEAEAAITYLLQNGSVYWDDSGGPPEPAGWFPGGATSGAAVSAPKVDSSYYSEYNFNADGSVRYGKLSVNQDAYSGYLRVTDLPTVFGTAVDYYNFAAISPATDRLGPDPGSTTTDILTVAHSFNAFGQPVAWREWTKFSSGSVSSDGTAVSAKLGRADESSANPIPLIPVWDGNTSYGYDYPGYDRNANRIEGFQITDQTAVLLWDFTYI